MRMVDRNLPFGIFLGPYDASGCQCRFLGLPIGLPRVERNYDGSWCATVAVAGKGFALGRFTDAPSLWRLQRQHDRAQRRAANA